VNPLCNVESISRKSYDVVVAQGEVPVREKLCVPKTLSVLWSERIGYPGGMIALILFVLGILASPFKAKSRLEAENAAVRQQLIVLRRKVKSRPRLANTDR
jgi:hypothetical protein